MMWSKSILRLSVYFVLLVSWCQGIPSPVSRAQAQVASSEPTALQKRVTVTTRWDIAGEEMYIMVESDYSAYIVGENTIECLEKAIKAMQKKKPDDVIKKPWSNHFYDVIRIYVWHNDFYHLQWQDVIKVLGDKGMIGFFSQTHRWERTRFKAYTKTNEHVLSGYMRLNDVFDPPQGLFPWARRSLPESVDRQMMPATHDV